MQVVVGDQRLAVDRVACIEEGLPQRLQIGRQIQRASPCRDLGDPDLRENAAGGERPRREQQMPARRQRLLHELSDGVGVSGMGGASVTQRQCPSVWQDCNMGQEPRVSQRG